MTSNVGSFNPPKEHWKWCIENGASSFTLKSLLSEQNVLLQFSCFCMWTNGKIVTKTSSASAAGVWPPSGVGERGQDHPRAESSCFGHDYWVNILTPDIIRLEACFRCVRSQCALTISRGSDWETNSKEAQSAMGAQTAKRRPWNNPLIQLVVQRWRQSDVGQPSLTLTSIWSLSLTPHIVRNVKKLQNCRVADMYDICSLCCTAKIRNV